MLKRRSTYLVGGAILTAFVAGLLIGTYLAEPPETIIPSEYFDQMALLTWKGWSGDLCFLLVPMTDSARAQHDFWSKWNGHCGIAKLKEELAAVPKKKYVYWQNKHDKFQYPTHQFVDQILEFANSKGVHLELNPAFDTELFTDWQPR